MNIRKKYTRYFIIGFIIIFVSNLAFGKDYSGVGHKVKLDKNIYYDSYFTPEGTLDKTEIIIYQTGLVFNHNDIPHLKKIVERYKNIKDYPFDKLNLQFQHLKEEMLSTKNVCWQCHSGWHYRALKTLMELEYYPKINESRIKITLYLIKK